MIKIAVLLAVAACVNAGVLVRTPQHDSAVIQSDRVGGSFAYSSVEGHAYADINPVVTIEQHHVAIPVVQQHAVAYSAPFVAAHPVPVPVPVFGK